MHVTNRATPLLKVLVLLLALFSLLAAGCSSQPDGKALVDSRCITCHSLRTVNEATKSADEWETTVARMVSLGARLNASEQSAVVQYLSHRDQ